MANLIITSGEKYSDIDVLACAVAYKNLCYLKGLEAEVVLLGPLNESISKTVRTWNFTYNTSVDNFKNYKYVLVDVSDPTYFSKFVDENSVIEIYDHHWGFENYWKNKIASEAKIEPVGACATLVWEEFKKLKFEQKIDEVSAKLLYTAIISNTLNLNAQVTTNRDRSALEELKFFANLSITWIAEYFSEVSESIYADPKHAMVNDTKVLEIKGIQYKIIQIELWNSQKFISENLAEIEKLLSKPIDTYSFLTSPCISEGKNYIITLNDKVKKKLKNFINVDFEGSLGKTDKLWLRKEIIREVSK